MTLVAILTVKKEAIERFRAFEKHAAAVMRDHGGQIETAIVVEEPGSPELIKEIHVITFPNEESYSDYRDDKRLARFVRLREQSVVHTEVFVGEEVPAYAS